MKIQFTMPLVGAMLLAAAGAQASTLYSSSFEVADGQDAVTANTYNTYNAGSAFGGGWTVLGVPGQTGIDLVNNLVTPASDGVNWVDLAGTPGPGGISRQFTAIAGETYTLTWDDFDGVGDSYDVVFGETGLTGITGGQPWRNNSLSFTAVTGGSETLSFFSPDNNNGNVGLDNVRIEAVPEPATIAALGIGAIGLIRRKRRTAK